MNIWQQYAAEGVVVWGIASQDEVDALLAYRDDLGLSFPILVDETGEVHAAYSQQTAFGGTVYPQDWIIGADGRVAYINNGYDPEAMLAILEAELAN